MKPKIFLFHALVLSGGSSGYLQNMDTASDSAWKKLLYAIYGSEAEMKQASNLIAVGKIEDWH